MSDTQPGSPLSASDAEEIGPYRLLRRLGSGAMGRVYLAVAREDPAAEPVALKLIHEHLADQPLFRRRFAHELAAMRSVRDPHTARLLTADSDAPQPWFASTYVPGPGIDAAVAVRGPLPSAEVAAIGVGIARGLAAIHAARIVHRDLKPANVLLGRDGPVVIDFGIARAADATYLTATGLQVGTFEFMSPEQASGRFVGPPSDVFALGSVLFFAATGHSPFAAGSAPAIAQLIVGAPPAADAAAAISPGLREVVLGCLEKDPAQRPDLERLVDALTAVITAGAAATAPPADAAARLPVPAPATEFASDRVRPAPPAAVAVPAPRRRRVVFASTAIAFVVATAVVLALLLDGGGAKPQATSLTGGSAASAATTTSSAGGVGGSASRSATPFPSVSTAVTNTTGAHVTTPTGVPATTPTRVSEVGGGASVYDETVGVGCPTGKHAEAIEYEFTPSHPWSTGAAASWSVAHCGDSVAYTATTPAVSPTEWYNEYRWIFAQVPSGAECTFHVYIADSPHSEHTASYFWFDGAQPASNSADDDTFTIDQASHHGVWVDYGPEVIRSGSVTLEFTDRRVSTATGTMTASAARLTCT